MFQPVIAIADDHAWRPGPVAGGLHFADQFFQGIAHMFGPGLIGRDRRRAEQIALGAAKKIALASRRGLALCMIRHGSWHNTGCPPRVWSASSCAYDQATKNSAASPSHPPMASIRSLAEINVLLRDFPHKVIIIAVARKLVTIANALCKSRKMQVDQTARKMQLLAFDKKSR